jgi:hypothetical protein
VGAQKFDFIQSECGCGDPCYVGATFSQQIIWQKEDALNPGVFIPVDISGYTAKMHVRKDIGTALIIELSTANNRISINGLQGILNLTISAADTSLLIPGNYKYSLELTDTNNVVTILTYGIFQILGQVTV